MAPGRDPAAVSEQFGAVGPAPVPSSISRGVCWFGKQLAEEVALALEMVPVLMGTPENASSWRSDQCRCSLVCCVAPGRLSRAPCPASPWGLSWDRGTASGTVWGGCQGAVGCTQPGEGSGQHPPAPAATAAPNQPGRKGTLETSQDQGGKGGEPPCTHRLSPSEQCQGAEPRACSSWRYWGSSQQRVRISPCCSAPLGGAELCWALWGRARLDAGRCAGKLLYVSLTDAKCSVSQRLEQGICPSVLPSVPQ